MNIPYSQLVYYNAKRKSGPNPLIEKHGKKPINRDKHI